MTAHIAKLAWLGNLALVVACVGHIAGRL